MAIQLWVERGPGRSVLKQFVSEGFYRKGVEMLYSCSMNGCVSEILRQMHKRCILLRKRAPVASFMNAAYCKSSQIRHASSTIHPSFFDTQTHR
jgi:hypothetical protein